MKNIHQQEFIVSGHFKIVNMRQTSPCDWDARTYGRMRQAEESGEIAEVLCVACEVDGNFEHDYHDIRFSDGRVVHAVSGFHLKRCQFAQ